MRAFMVLGTCTYLVSVQQSWPHVLPLTQTYYLNDVLGPQRMEKTC